MRKNSKVRPRQRHWDGSFSNFHLSEDRRLYWGPTHYCSSCLQTEKATDGAKGKIKKQHSKNTKSKTCCLYSLIIWTSDWLRLQKSEILIFVFTSKEDDLGRGPDKDKDASTRTVLMHPKRFVSPPSSSTNPITGTLDMWSLTRSNFLFFFFSFASVVYCQTCWEEQMSCKWKCALIS